MESINCHNYVDRLNNPNRLNNLNRPNNLSSQSGRDNLNHLGNLKDDDLNQKVKTLVTEERKLKKEILLYLVEVDKRKLYLRMAYPSFFEYLVKEISYSEGAAQRRIDTARLLQKIPEASTQIEDGRLHLSQISKLQKICRHIKKESGNPVELSIQKTVLQKLEKKNLAQTDFILAQEFQTEVKTTYKKIVQKDESVRVELTLTKQEAALLQRAQELLSNKTGGGLKDTLVEMAERTVKSFEPKIHRQKPSVALEKKNTVGKEGGGAGERERAGERKRVGVRERERERVLKSITPRIKKEILGRDKICQFKDPKTGQICGSKHFLEIDHIHPIYRGGLNTSPNLRAMCKNHNLFRFQAKLE